MNAGQHAAHGTAGHFDRRHPQWQQPCGALDQRTLLLRETGGSTLGQGEHTAIRARKLKRIACEVGDLRLIECDHDAPAFLQAPADLADQVEGLLARRLLEGLGLARRAGALSFGFDKVHADIAGGRAAWLVEASDGAADGRAKLVHLARRQAKPPELLGAFTSGELGLALGLENVVHLAFLAGRGAERWTRDVQRFSGFRPLLPESWREEP